MKIYLLIILLICFFCSGIFAQNKITLENIIPLVSTREDIEAIFGKSQAKCNCIYETSNETINVNYLKKPCDDGWNAPIETVLSFSVEPKSKTSIDKLDINLSNFIKIADDAFFFTYINLQKGIKIFTSPYDEVEKYEYIPTSVNSLDNKLRCRNYPKFNPMNDVYIPALNYTIKTWNNDVSEIDNLITMFSETKDTNLYVFVYFSKDTNKENKSAYLQKLRNHFRKRLENSNNNIKITYGGVRKSSEIVAFILQKTLPEPTAMPDFR